MRLAFDNEAHYADLGPGYELYLKRTKKEPVDEKTYRRVVKTCCRKLADKLVEDGMVDLPCRLGSIAAATLTRRPQYRGKTFIGYGKKDYTTGLYDGTLKAFGIVFLPRRGRNNNLRCYGFVANRRLFKRVKERYDNDRPWVPVTFDDTMI